MPDQKTTLDYAKRKQRTPIWILILGIVAGIVVGTIAAVGTCVAFSMIRPDLRPLQDRPHGELIVFAIYLQGAAVADIGLIVWLEGRRRRSLRRAADLLS